MEHYPPHHCLCILTWPHIGSALYAILQGTCRSLYFSTAPNILSFTSNWKPMDCRAPCGSPRADPLADGAMAGSKWDISKIWWILMNETLPKHVETTKILSWSPTYQEIPGALDHGAKVQFYPLRRPSIPSALREFVGVQHRYHGPLGPHSTAADLYAHPPCADAKSPQQTPAAAFKARAMMENGGRAPSACHFNGKNHGKSM